MRKKKWLEETTRILPTRTSVSKMNAMIWRTSGNINSQITRMSVNKKRMLRMFTKDKMVIERPFCLAPHLSNEGAKVTFMDRHHRFSVTRVSSFDLGLKIVLAISQKSLPRHTIPGWWGSRDWWSKRRSKTNKYYSKFFNRARAQAYCFMLKHTCTQIFTFTSHLPPSPLKFF